MEIPDQAKTVFMADEAGIQEQLDLARTLLERVRTGTIKGLLLTIADAPPVESLNAKQLAEIADAGMKPEDATRLAHVLIGPVNTLKYLLIATSACIRETIEMSAVQAIEKVTDETIPPNTSVH